jgi:hypothetical protein
MAVFTPASYGYNSLLKQTGETENMVVASKLATDHVSLNEFESQV